MELKNKNSILFNTSKVILLRIPGLGLRFIDKILAITKLRKNRLIDLLKMREHLDKLMSFAVIKVSNPPLTQLDSLNFAIFYRPETHVQLDLLSSLPVCVAGEF